MKKSLKSLTSLVLSTCMLFSLSACDSSLLPSMSGDENEPGATLQAGGDRYRDANNGYFGGAKEQPKTTTGDKPVLNDKGEDIRDIDVIVQEVIEGKYANGEERKKLLGDRYQQVMDKVNYRCLVEKDPLCGAYN